MRGGRTRLGLAGALLGSILAVVPLSAAAASSPHGQGVAVTTEYRSGCQLVVQSPAVSIVSTGAGEAQAFGKAFAPEAGVTAYLDRGGCGVTSGGASLYEFYDTGVTFLVCHGFGSYGLSKASIQVVTASVTCVSGNRQATTHLASASFHRVGGRFDIATFQVS
jgi:hypothetical protein